MAEALGNRAFYRQRRELVFIGNPLIEALPREMSADRYEEHLRTQVPHQAVLRQASVAERLKLLDQMRNLHVPRAVDRQLFEDISCMIRYGYADRNPLPFEQVQVALAHSGVEANHDRLWYLQHLRIETPVLSVIGSACTGKTHAVQHVLETFPQVIEHEDYYGYRFARQQLVYLRVVCPEHPRFTDFLERILAGIDQAVGTHYMEEASQIRWQGIPALVCQAACAQFLGVLFVDSLERIRNCSEEVGQQILHFLLETLHVPVIIATRPAPLDVLADTSETVRNLIDEGIKIDPMRRYSPAWEHFYHSFQVYQFVQEEILDTLYLNRVLYDLSEGLPTAAALYRMGQEDVLRRGREEMTVDDLHRVAQATPDWMQSPRED